MGAVAFIVLMGALLTFSLGVAVAGLVGLIICAQKKRKGLRNVFTVVLALGVLGVLLSLGLVGSILYGNTVIPENFVNTGVVIEGDIYQSDTFTAGDTVYRKLDLEPNQEAFATSEPVFSYMPEGILNLAQWCNFYRVENSQGFDLIWNGAYSLYCPSHQYDAVMDHYASCDRKWYVYDEAKDRPLSDHTSTALEAFVPTAEESIAEAVVKEYTLCCYSADGLIRLRGTSLLQVGSSLYWIYTATYHPDPLPPEYTGCKLPEELAALLLDELSG